MTKHTRARHRRHAKKLRKHAARLRQHASTGVAVGSPVWGELRLTADKMDGLANMLDALTSR